MAFGIGLESELVKTYEKNNHKSQKPIACECWFTSSGRTIPRKIKFKDEQGILQLIDQIDICYCEKMNYSGIPSYEYLCKVLAQGLFFDVKLIYYPDTCKWFMEY
jgi:hypothetical protein